MWSHINCQDLHASCCKLIHCRFSSSQVKVGHGSCGTVWFHLQLFPAAQSEIPNHGCDSWHFKVEKPATLWHFTIFTSTFTIKVLCRGSEMIGRRVVRSEMHLNHNNLTSRDMPIMDHPRFHKSCPRICIFGFNSMFIQEYHGIKPSISHHTHSLLLAHVLKLMIHGRHGSTKDLTRPTEKTSKPSLTQRQTWRWLTKFDVYQVSTCSLLLGLTANEVEECKVWPPLLWEGISIHTAPLMASVPVASVEGLRCAIDHPRPWGGGNFPPYDVMRGQDLDSMPWTFKESVPSGELVGGWTNPFEKYDRQNGSFPQVEVKIKTFKKVCTPYVQ